MLWHYIIKLDNSKVYTGSGCQVRNSRIYGIELADNEIIMNLDVYNKIFGTDYTKTSINEFIPHTVNMKHYKYFAPEEKNILFSLDIKIVGLFTNGVNNIAGTMITGDAVYEAFAKNYFYTTGLLYEGNETIDACFDVAERLNFKQRIGVVDGIHSMTTAVEVFIPIFEFISMFLYIGVIFILMNFASKMINDKMHEIGILKALGTKNGSIGVVFGLQVGLIALLTCGLSTLGYYLFIDVANDILIESIHRIAPSWTLPDLQFLTFKPEIALMNCLLIFALAFVSLIFPMIKIKAIKPVKIIKAKE